MPFIPLDHIGTECSTSEPVHQRDHDRTRRGLPVTGQVDLDQLLDSLWREFEDGVVGSYSCVVDEDTGSAELFSDFVCGSINGFGVGNVALDIVGDD
jgi:hypothetical protein